MVSKKESDLTTNCFTLNGFTWRTFQSFLEILSSIILYLMVIFLTEDPSLFSISFHVMSINTVLGITLTPVKDPGTPEII